MKEKSWNKGFNFVGGGVCAPRGFTANGIHCGIRKNKSKLDLALIYSQEICKAAALYTQNLVYGAPITVTKQGLENNRARAVICNSGVANTCAADGVEKALAMRDITATALGIEAEDVIIASTGVIGKSLPLEPIEIGMPALAKGLNLEGSDSAAQAIMTTDTRKKEFALEFKVGEKVCYLGGISKGSGMICPNMATMLCFITTDANIEDEALEAALKAANRVSFNMLSVDGDTSTNDMVSIMANGLAGNDSISLGSEDYEVFEAALTELCTKLAREMAADGEGATKLIECEIQGAKDEETARVLAKSVINSALVKTAMFGEDANWGRIICAMGYAGTELDVSKVKISFESKAGSIDVCEKGAALDFSEERAAAILAEDEIVIRACLADGEGYAKAFGCDFSYDYVKINGDYRT